MVREDSAQAPSAFSHVPTLAFGTLGKHKARTGSCRVNSATGVACHLPGDDGVSTTPSPPCIPLQVGWSGDLHGPGQGARGPLRAMCAPSTWHAAAGSSRASWTWPGRAPWGRGRRRGCGCLPGAALCPGGPHGPTAGGRTTRTRRSGLPGHGVPLTRAPQPNNQEEGRFGTLKIPLASPRQGQCPLCRALNLWGKTDPQVPASSAHVRAASPEIGRGLAAAPGTNCLLPRLSSQQPMTRTNLGTGSGPHEHLKLETPRAPKSRPKRRKGQCSPKAAQHVTARVTPEARAPNLGDTHSRQHVIPALGS